MQPLHCVNGDGDNLEMLARYGWTYERASPWAMALQL